MKTDLFASKESQLEQFCKSKGYFTSHDINFWGTTHYFDSATRRIREWVDEYDKTGRGKVRRLSKDEMLLRGFDTKCAVYCWI